MSGGALEPYRVAAGEARAELRERGSRFLAVVRTSGDEAAARALLEEVAGASPDATHHCWAWRLGHPPEERSSDAGEPSGTAGRPILDALRGAELTDVAAVVARWFGGTKLGRGGLARAYGGVARRALEELPVARRVPTVRLRLELPYERVGPLQRLVHPPDVEIVQERYGERVELVLRVRADRRSEVVAGLAGLGIEPRGDPERGA